MELRDRIKEAIGDEPVAAFARRCGFGESLLRKYLAGSEPSATNLARIADAAGVSLDWLATGRGPKRRISTGQQLQVIEGEGKSTPARDGASRLLRQIEGIIDALPEEEALRKAQELFARAQEMKEQHELRQALAELRARLDATGT